MDKYALILSNSFGEINRNEVIESISSFSKIIFIDDRFIICETKKENEWLFSTIYSIKYYGKLFDYIKIEEFNKNINLHKFNFSKVKLPYKIQKIIAIPKPKYNNLKKEIEILSVENIANYVWDNFLINNIEPKIDFNKYNTSIDFVVIEKYIVIIENSKKGNDSFKFRENKKRPEQHPTTMKPELARSLINQLNLIKYRDKNISIIDGFCGAGGFLVEICALEKELKSKWDIYGNDLALYMLKKAEMNLKFFGYKANLSNFDCTKINKKFDFMISDLPYGSHSKLLIGLDKLIEDTIFWIKNNIKKRAIIILPSKYENIVSKSIKNNNLKLINKQTIYVHKSLTRNIYVLKLE